MLERDMLEQSMLEWGMLERSMLEWISIFRDKCDVIFGTFVA